MASLSGWRVKRKLKLKKKEETKKLAGSLTQCVEVEPNSLVVSDTLPAVDTDAYIGK